MDYVEMIKDPELVMGFKELISDADAVVVKRTIRVFTSVYHHTLRLFSIGDLEEETLMKSWGPVKGVVDTLIGMMKHCENEGIFIHLLRFLEAAVTSHLIYDFSRFPFVFERGREVVKNGLKALKDFVMTPYVGGASYIVGVRALISIACSRPDLWEPVTDLLKKQLTALPPTLFDHNVRSLNKTLQRNLFRLLRRAETPELKEKLIEMMVGVGVPRKMVMPWASAVSDGRKRLPIEVQEEMNDSSFPPAKKPRTDDPISNDLVVNFAPPSDPRLALVHNPNNTKQTDDSELSAGSSTKENNAELKFLTSLIPTGKSQDKTSSFANEIYEKLDMEKVCKLVIQNLEDLPTSEPAEFAQAFEKHGKIFGDLETLRKRLSLSIAKYLIDHNIESLVNESKPESLVATTKVVRENSLEASKKTANCPKSNSNSSSASSTPSSTPPLLPLYDTDMRQSYSKPPCSSMGDVDMRVANPRVSNLDPRMAKDPRIRKDVTDPRVSELQARTSALTDPRLTSKAIDTKPRLDPRLVNSNEVKPRKTRWDPRLPQENVNIPFSSSATSQSIGSSVDVVASKPNDPRINRPMPQSLGLLPHPDPRIQNPNGGDIAMHQNFNPLAQFPFGPINPMGHFNNPFVGGLPMSSMPPPLLGSSSFTWNNNLGNPPPPLLVAQTLASVQSGMMPPTMLNL